MKLKRILSTALTVVMIFTTLVAVFPTSAGAAHSASSASSNFGIPTGYKEANLNSDQLTKYLEGILNYDYDDAYELFLFELKEGYLYRIDSEGGLYSLYVNKYSGVVYYLNNVTGQILTSNPSNIGYKNEGSSVPVVSGDTAKILMSQIKLEFCEAANSQVRYTYASYAEAALRGQISVTPISGGLRVNYVIGDTTSRYLLPGIIPAESFEKYMIVPFIQHYEELFVSIVGEDYLPVDFSFFENPDYEVYSEFGYFNLNGKDGLLDYLKDMLNTAKKAKEEGVIETAEYNSIYSVNSDMIKLFSGSTYNCLCPEEIRENSIDSYNGLVKQYPITGEGVTIYVYSGSQINVVKNKTANLIKKYCPEYTFAQMYQDENYCGYVDKSIQKPVFRCALEYTFNDDGSLSVRLPANSITFDETVYRLESITPLQTFGSADVKNSGYIFYPDGSGAVIDFKDFYDESTGKRLGFKNPDGVIYGKDYCYSEITGIYCAQVIMPVYGVVNERKASPITKTLYGKETVTNGYFAIIEEGDALASLQYDSGGASYRFASAFSSYSPRPSDTYNLSETISVGSLSDYIMVADTKYSGSYVTRYVMLCDETVGQTVYGKDGYYSADYSGMAAYYRNYLKENGTLEALENFSEDMPLYMDVFGSMEILDRILTFPVMTSIPLTEFEDVVEIFNQLSGAKEYVNSKISELEKLLEAETKDEIQRNVYKRQIEQYNSIKDKIQNITNINFRLTGFANGGMYHTYPSKVKWESACGGESGLEELIGAANEAGSNGLNFGIYPDFDFAYVNKTSTFDGISFKGTIAKMVDNRYAKKQIYDIIALTYIEDKNQLALVVSPGAIDELYEDFNEDYSETGLGSISVSTLGSSLNSSFDKDASVNREESKAYVSALLDKMANKNGYDVMIDTGNIYAVKYASHILNVEIDSSNMRYSSYVVPFVGMVLHSYVNYSGTPFNYSASPNYDLLRHIENGAALQYIAAYQNSAYLKEDVNLSKYYGVDYANWYTSILETYYILNEAIGSLQDYEIYDHTTLLAERVIEAKENEANYKRLKAEALEIIDAQIAKAVDEALISLKESGASSDVRLKIDIDRDAIVEIISVSINMDKAELDTGDFKTQLDAIIASYENEYKGAEDEANTYLVTFSEIEYESKYNYVTDSLASDKNYETTDYTVAGGKVTIVTYRKGDSEVKFLLNYNNFSVNVKLDENTTVTLEKYSFKKL